MKLEDDISRRIAAEQALRRAAALGVDATSLKGKSLTALIELFQAYDRYKEDRDRAVKEADALKFNTSVLSRYGISRSTIEHNPVLSEIAKVFQEKQDTEKVVLTKTQYDNIMAENETLRLFHDNAIDIGIENERLRAENDKMAKMVVGYKALIDKFQKSANLANDMSHALGLKSFDELLKSSGGK